MGSPRNPDIGSGGAIESGQDSGLSFVSLTETPEEQPHRGVNRSQISPPQQAQAVSSVPGQVRPIAIPTQPLCACSSRVGTCTILASSFSWELYDGYPPPPANFPGSFPVGLGMGIPPCRGRTEASTLSSSCPLGKS